MHDGGACHITSGQYTHDETYILLSRAVATTRWTSARKEVYFGDGWKTTSVTVIRDQPEADQHETNVTDDHHYYLRNKNENYHAVIPSVLNVSRKII